MTRQAAEQVIAGVVLSEPLATSAYGRLYRAQWGEERNLRGLVVNASLMASDIFRVSLSDPSAPARAAGLGGPHIAATIAVEAAGRNAVVLTRGQGACKSIVDVLTEGRSRDATESRLSIPVAAAIARSVAEALRVAHDAGVPHGAVHPRSVWIGQDGVVKLDDFVVVDALRRAVAHGELAAVWRGLSDYVAPELTPGRPPTMSCDLFAVGALMVAMLTGAPPPGGIYATPGIERFLRRAIDVDSQRRHQSATELLDDLYEAMEDDRWEFAEPGEICERAGLAAVDGDVDDATEDLLASLADSAQSTAASRSRRGSTSDGLDSLLGDIGTRADSSDGFDDGDDDRDDVTHVSKMHSVPTEHPIEAVVPPPRFETPVPRSTQAEAVSQSGHLETPVRYADELEAMQRDERPQLSSSAMQRDERQQLSPSTMPSPRAAAQAVASGTPVGLPPHSLLPTGAHFAEPRDGAEGSDVGELSPRLTSRMPGVIGFIALALVGYFVYHHYTNQQQLDAEAKQRAVQSQRDAEEKQRQAIEDLPDPGAIRVTSNPPQAGVWLKIGRTPVKSFQLSSAMMHELRVEGVDGFDPVDTQVVATHWNHREGRHTAAISVSLLRAKVDARSGKPVPVVLPPMPPTPPATRAADFRPGHGSVEITSTPAGAEVWMYIGMTNNVELQGIQAGLPYELRLLATGYRPGFISITADDWRSGGEPTAPIDRAKKRAVLEKSIDLVPDPAAVASKKPSKGR